MTFFSVIIGLLIGTIVFIPIFFIKQKSTRVLIAIITILMVFLGAIVSQRYLYPHYLLWRFEKVLATQPVFILIAQNHPEEYKKYLNEIQSGFKRSADIDLVSSATAGLLNKIFNEHLEKAPNGPIDLYLKSTIELYRYLYTKMPQAIVMMETGRPANNVDLAQLSQDLTFETLLSHLLDSKKLIIQDSIKSPVNTLNSTDANGRLEKIYESLSQKFGPEIIRNVFIPSDVPVPPRISSLVILEFYSEILATGKENAGEIMRYIGSKNYKAQKN